MLVSPTLLMLAIQVVQQIQKDARMREATDLIRTEVGLMMKDVRLFGERVRKKLQSALSTRPSTMSRDSPDLGRPYREACLDIEELGSTATTRDRQLEIVAAPLRQRSRRPSQSMTY